MQNHNSKDTMIPTIKVHPELKSNLRVTNSAFNFLKRQLQKLSKTIDQVDKFTRLYLSKTIE